jgi:hypothetical protein
MQIRIIKKTHVRGIPQEEGNVIDVSTAEANQYISSGHAEDISHKEEELENKKEKKVTKRKIK